ncbi:hypothetical protein SAMN05444955_102120 [Lihuaxuella thermophila]|uniref:Uncharacterized protein n=1 Tax=Lihuaxuella thermophila TaxID=1173111 RepID=A0A1H8BD34_9BACL|nr:hypothetical protein SAMN05444955_102120 [Lihuaxuella thermophila]
MSAASAFVFRFRSDAAAESLPPIRRVWQYHQEMPGLVIGGHVRAALEEYIRGWNRETAAPDPAGNILCQSIRENMKTVLILGLSGFRSTTKLIP